MKRTLIILPCAGMGVRIGLPYPKELFAIDKNTTIIDTYFALLYPIKDLIRIIVIVNNTKSSLIKYLCKYANEFDIIFRYQPNFDQGIIDALYSCKEYFLELNVVLLPDTYVEYINFVEELLSLYKTSDEIAIWFKKENNTELLKALGPVEYINDNKQYRIKNFEEKPVHTTCNAFWVTIAFKYTSSEIILNDLSKIYNKSVLPIKESIIYNALGFEVNTAIDLGVWENIKMFFADGIYKHSESDNISIDNN